MALSCVYCGGSHASTAEMRDCWNAHGGREVEAGTTGAPPAAERPEPRPLEQLAGPEALGRDLVLDRAQPVPLPWQGAHELLVDAALLSRPDACHALRERQAAARRTVIRLAAPFERDAPPDTRVTLPLHELGPTFQLVHDDLWHLVWRNAVDGRAGDGTGTWWLADAAGAEVGASPAGDVTVAGRGPVWLDGGPLRFVAPIDGVPVVHRVVVEHGALARALPSTNDPGPSAAALAPDQLAAVTHPGGAARIIAPAGSGKTRVLTERARLLLTGWRLPGSAVSLVAFNTRAQGEMRERTADLHGSLQVRTLNSIALAVVNGTPPFAPRPVQRRTITEGEVRQVLGRLVSVPRRRNTDPFAPWIEALSAARLGLRSPADVEAGYDGDVAGFAEVFGRYREELARRQVLDFDEQIVAAVELLLADPSARRQAQRACRAVLVDEFQDLTPAHLLLVRLLAGPDLAVFAVGDDDQTIYGYNGADPSWLIDFEELFPGAGDHPLEVNYRCPAGVVRAADTLLRHNQRRVQKVIRPGAAQHTGWSVERDADTLASSLNVVRDALDRGRPADDVAVLTRVNALLAPLHLGLTGAGVPVKGGVGRDFLQRTAVRATLAWLRLGGGRFGADDVNEALRRPSRSLHPRIVEWAGEARSLDDLVRLAGRLREPREADRIEEFAADIATVQSALGRGRSTAQVLSLVFDQIGLAGAVSSLDANRHGMNRGAQHDDLVALAQLATLHPDAATFVAWLAAQLASPVTDADHGVTLATVHRVKGQEWPVVVIHEATATQFPHRLADDLEEERRLFHVAITRASHHVTVIAGAEPSPFVDELTSEPSPERRRVPARPTPRAAERPSGRQPASPADDPLRTALRSLRLELAAGKPAYTVFDDATMEAIVRARPASIVALGRVPGIGPKRLATFGERIVATVAAVAAPGPP